MKLRWPLGLFLFLLSVQYAYNPFVPGPESIPSLTRVTKPPPSARAPASSASTNFVLQPVFAPESDRVSTWISPDLAPPPHDLQRLSRHEMQVLADLARMEEKDLDSPVEDLFPLHFDQYGLIVQSDGDGGDTAQRTGMFYYLHDDRDGFTRSLQQLEVRAGIYVRHPHQAGFRSDPRRFSRDQHRPLLIALGKYKMQDRLREMAKQHALRLGKYQNHDFIGPVGIGEYIRAFECRTCYPILLVTDAFLAWGSIGLITHASLNPDEADDNNHIMSLLQARETMPTPLGDLAIYLYREHRPKNLGNFILGKGHPVEGALAWYHRADSGGNPYLGNAIYQAIEDR
jgi:hypothetical protein